MQPLRIEPEICARRAVSPTPWRLNFHALSLFSSGLHSPLSLAGGAPVSASIYEAVTSRIVDALARGVVPWRRPWKDSLPPSNAISKRPYRGVNLFLLGLARFSDHRWLTVRQANELGGTVKRGEQSSLAIFWKRWEVPPVLNELSRDPWVKTIPILRYYNVFNVEQCQSLRLAPLETTDEERGIKRLEHAELVVRAMQDPPRIHDRGGAAWYKPSEDLVQVPAITSFVSADSYYATLFHELGHATGHEKRLNRPGVMGEIRFGSAVYSHEELVAELTSAFCCAALALDNTIVENAASYIGGWHTALKADPRAIVVAAAQAQRAADMIRGVSFDPS